MLNKFFGWFFNKKDERDLAKTGPLPPEPITQPQPAPSLQQVQPSQFQVGCAQSVGKIRDHNEDTLYLFNSTFSSEDVELPFGVFIVADGMGGHEHGEVASRVATQTVASYLLTKLYASLLNHSGDGETFQEAMENAVLMAQQEVVHKAPGGGTTLSVAIVFGNQITFAHVGDSRIYTITPNGDAKVITQDHSLVHRLVELGQITEEDARTHPQKNVLYRAIGQLEPFRPDISTSSLPRPCSILLCSDGLWGVVPHEEIIRIVNHIADPRLACAELVAAANRGGGPDNISAILVKYTG